MAKYDIIIQKSRWQIHQFFQTIHRWHIHVNSFSGTSYCSNSEHWTQKHIQSGSIHSITLDVYVDRQSAQNLNQFGSGKQKNKTKVEKHIHISG